MPPPIATADELMGEIRREILQVPAGSGAGHAPPSRAESSSWQWGTTVYFRKGEPWCRLLVSGWSYPEAEFIWSDGAQATIQIEAPPARRDLLLHLSMVPFCPPGVAEQIIRISDERRLIALGVVPEPGESAFLVPSSPAADKSLRLFLSFPNAISPYQAGMSSDHRKLAIALKSLTGHLL
jgi:hypothetical protein